MLHSIQPEPESQPLILVPYVGACNPTCRLHRRTNGVRDHATPYETFGYCLRL